MLRDDLKTIHTRSVGHRPRRISRLLCHLQLKISMVGVSPTVSDLQVDVSSAVTDLSGRCLADCDGS